jgi:hypothetical protein
MSTQVQYRYGSNTDNNAFTGALAEITVDTTNNTLRVHNGATVGGFSLISANATQTLANKTYQGVSVSVTGNVTGGNVLNNGLISSTGNSIAGNYLTVGLISATGNITGGNLTVGTGTIIGGNIVNANGNGVGNIGSSTGYFNTIFAQATSAQYADLAEMYVADANYTPGTVLDFGGSEEVTATTQSHSTRVAGIVSTNPSYLMNSTLTCTNAVEVALVGRVPCHVVGTIAKGDRLVASSTPGVATRLDMTQYQPGCIIGKALEAYNSEIIGTIEVAVGRF